VAEIAQENRKAKGEYVFIQPACIPALTGICFMFVLHLGVKKMNVA